MDSRTAASSPSTSRRRALGLLGAGGAAAFAALFSRQDAQAGHDGTNTFHLGESNTNPTGTRTVLNANGDRALDIEGTFQISGESRFSTAGSAAVPAGESSVFVADTAVTASSHISVTLMSNPRGRAVTWVERDPGSGFTVHLMDAPPPRRQETTLTYLIVEPVS